MILAHVLSPSCARAVPRSVLWQHSLNDYTGECGDLFPLPRDLFGMAGMRGVRRTGRRAIADAVSADITY